MRFMIAFKDGPLAKQMAEVGIIDPKPGGTFRVKGHKYRLLDTNVLQAIIKGGPHLNLAAGAEYAQGRN